MLRRRANEAETVVADEKDTERKQGNGTPSKEVRSNGDNFSFDFPSQPCNSHSTSPERKTNAGTTRVFPLVVLTIVCCWELVLYISPLKLENALPITPSGKVTGTGTAKSKGKGTAIEVETWYLIPSTGGTAGRDLSGPQLGPGPVRLANQMNAPLEILFRRSRSGFPSIPASQFSLPPIANFDRADWKGDYGDLDFDTLEPNRFRRRIRDKDGQTYERERKMLLNQMNEYHVSSTYLPDDELKYTFQCERVAWKSASYPVCNTFHELTRNGKADKYLGHGYYRDAWLMADPSVDETETHADDFVLKQMRMPYDDDDTDHIPNAKSFAKIQREAIVMERLTASPYIITTYGHCALSVLSESMPFEVAEFIVPNSGHALQSEMDRLPKIISLNNYTTTEKLDMVLQMCKAIAAIHGFPGAIVHGDIHPVQWLRSKDGTIKLNDFNNAEILDWSRKENSYCKADRGSWGGMYRSPEEFIGVPIDEQIDVYSMGNNIYCILTGLWPFYELTGYTPIQKKVLNLERPYVDDRFRHRSYIERQLVEIMERMWEHKPKNRPSIFEVVDFLTEVQAVHIETSKLNEARRKEDLS